MDLPTKIDFAKVNCRTQLDRANAARAGVRLGHGKADGPPSHTARQESGHGHQP